MTINIEPLELKRVIANNQENALRDLIISKYEEAKQSGIVVKDFYYASHVACSDEPFDMFSLDSICSIFGLCGYSASWRETEKIGDASKGIVLVGKEDLYFEMEYFESMHDSLYACFVDTKTAVVTKIPSVSERIEQLLKGKDFELLVEVAKERLSDYSTYCSLHEENHPNNKGEENFYREGFETDLATIVEVLEELQQIKSTL
ncbi:MAG: hypothetical protein U9Q88_13175 [Bacillota bacterium]|nr:hypothetical protein [Bacillota bacterium]